MNLRDEWRAKKTATSLMRVGVFKTGLEQMISQELTSDMSMCEIGSFSGESTVLFARKVKSVVAIDPWTLLDEKEITTGVVGQINARFSMHEAEARFDQSVRGLPVVKIKNFDHLVVDKFPDGSFDFVYIDAIHTEEELSRQIASWLPKVRLGGKIGGHDYADRESFGYMYPQVKAVVDRLFPGARIYPDQSWVREVRAK